MKEEYKMGYNVAIDGPAGAGKSTIAKLDRPAPERARSQSWSQKKKVIYM